MNSPSEGRTTARGAVHGRFQVFHNGHFEYVKAASDLTDYLVVGITAPDGSLRSPELSYGERTVEYNNPLSYFDRAVCVEAALREMGRQPGTFSVVPFPIENPSRLLEYVPREFRHFITIYDQWGQEKERRLVALGLEVTVLWRDRIKQFSGTDVRENVRRGRPWRHLVPPSVSGAIDHWGLIEKIVQADTTTPRSQEGTK